MRRMFCLCLILPMPAFAGPCDTAADRAAALHDVPPALMRAITRAETARDGAPWPWTLNIGGQGHWFATAEDARHTAEAAIAGWAGQVDIGCFQLNLRWHGPAFASVSDMLDPDRNADHAARYLSQLHAELGDWRAATAAYHSRSAELGEAYVARVEAAHAASGGAVPDHSPPALRRNGFPLLVAGSGAAAGSVVPLPQSRRPIVGAP